ncbi:hypothetical protein [Luteolibacter sp. Populi]|uniref:hypothetical protein n=1 Tax=Luteolibacter sp. Populi TaxID=3230487 RepID=UPI00346734D2
MFTIFTLPKPFRGHIGVIQRNAIRSWTRLHPEVEILIFGNEEGAAEFAAELGIRHIPDVELNAYGTPRMDGYFGLAEQIARHPRMCYVNADIILFPDLVEAAGRVDLERFVMGGRRTDYDLTVEIDFARENWAEDLREDVKKNGKLHGYTGIDYFLYPRGMFGKIPPFALGRWYWDNWLVYRVRRLGGALIDATKSVTAIHQNHNYNHIHKVEQKGQGFNQGGIEAFDNRALVDSLIMSLEDADWQLEPSGMTRNSRWSRWRFINEAALQAELNEYPAWLRKPLVSLARMQWDRNWRTRYAGLLEEHPELLHGSAV